jgi:hypothetical protein
MERDQRTDRIARWSVIALIATVIADLAEDLIDPTGNGSAADVFGAASQHHGRMIVSAALLLATSLLIVPAVFGLVGTLRGRGRRIGHSAAGLALMGALGHAALAALYLAWAAMPSASADSGQMIALVERMNDSASFALVLPLIVAFPLSLVVLFIALVRGGVASRWVLAPTIAAPVVGIAAGSTGIALACFLIAACNLAVRVFGAHAAPNSAPLPATAPVVP